MDVYTLLIVDDEKSIVNSLKRVFRHELFDILACNSGEAAIDIIKNNIISVLLTDNLMPGIKGVELLKQVKNISPSTVRIIMTGHSEMDMVIKAINEGEAYKFILKPWDDNDMIITIKLAMAYYKLQEDNRLLREKLEKQNELLEVIKSKYPDVTLESGMELNLEK